MQEHLQNKWNKNPNLIVNSLTINQDSSLLTAATSNGYRIFDTVNYAILSHIDDYQDIIGELKLAVPLYRSQLVCFVGSEGNSSFPQTQLVVWDEYKKRKLGMLILTDPILDFKLTRNLIYLRLSNRILLFEIISLRYITSIFDVDPDKKKFSIADGNPNIIAFASVDEKSTVKVIKFKIENGKISAKFPMIILTVFSDIQSVQISPNGDLLMVASFLGNKVHIYSLVDFQLKYCIYLGKKKVNLDHVSFDKAGKFFLFLNDMTYLNIYKLKHSQGVYICQCDDHDDSAILQPQEQPKTSSFFGGLFSSLTNKIFAEGIDPFASTRFVYKSHSSDFFLIMNFDNIQKDEIVY